MDDDAAQGRSGKNDTNDAEAICEAAGRPRMAYVPIKCTEQQALLLHRLRATCVTDHTRTVNQRRGMLAAFGVVVAQGPDACKRHWPEIRHAHAEQTPALAWECRDALYAELQRVHLKVLELDRRLKAFVHDNDAASRLATIPGWALSPLRRWLPASAMAATSAMADSSLPGRAWCRDSPALGVSPGSGASPNLRTLLVHGARSEMTRTASRTDQKSRWAEALKVRKGWSKAVVTLTNKHARIAWALLAHQQTYQPT